LADETVPLSTTNGVRKQEYNPNANALGSVYRIYKMFQSSLSSEDRDTHTMTVIHAMETLENGEDAVWYNQREKTAGKIRIVMTYPVQGGYCRKFFTQVQINENVRDYTEVGCKTMDTPYWIFSR
jgi:surface antigen